MTYGWIVNSGRNESSARADPSNGLSEVLERQAEWAGRIHPLLSEIRIIDMTDCNRAGSAAKRT